MFLIMNSKEMDLFLNNEYDNDILEAQYVIVSNRIRKVGTAHDNIVTANVLFPDSEVLCMMETGEFESAYFNQLRKNITLLAFLIESCIINNQTIVLLNTKREDKLGDYLTIIGKFIMNTFDFPVYRYADLAKGKIDFIDYDEAKVYEICHKIIDKAVDRELFEKIIKDKKLNHKNKKRLKQILKDNDLYTKGMSVSEMKTTAEVLLSDDYLINEE